MEINAPPMIVGSRSSVAPAIFLLTLDLGDDFVAEACFALLQKV
jgi:hypothetical protein